MTIDTLSTIKCPACAYEAIELMPTDTLVQSYACKDCGTVFYPHPEHDCVFCSHGDVPCPPTQTRRAKTAREGSCCGACGG